MSFGENLQALRRKQKMTQEEFAAQLRVSRQAVSKWESGRGYPEIEKILYICNRYGTTMNELFSEEVPVLRERAVEQEKTAPVPVRPLKGILSDFFSNLSVFYKWGIGGLLAAAALLLLLLGDFQLRGGSDDMMTIVWTAAIIIFGIAEAATAALVSIWFVAGALAALIAAFAGASLPVQIVLFLVVSAVALVLTRPLMRKINNAATVPTNADRVFGTTGKVTETIDNENATGAVYVDGKTWSARSQDGSIIPAGTMVTIGSMEGVKLFVKKIQENMEVE